MAVGGCVAAGFTDFALIAYHFEKTRSVASGVIPVFYAAAMAMGAIRALALGRLFDRLGIAVVAFLLSSLFAPFVFLARGWGALIGMILWGIGIGARTHCASPWLSELFRANDAAPRLACSTHVLASHGFSLHGLSLTGLIGFLVLSRLASVPLFLLGERCRQRGPA
jgi:hypothetical protein